MSFKKSKSISNLPDISNPYTLRGQQLGVYNEYLYIIIYCKLNFDKHIAANISKATNIVNIKYKVLHVYRPG